MKNVQPQVQARGSLAGARARVGVAQAARDLDVHQDVLRKWIGAPTL